MLRGVGCFALGAITQSVVAQSRRPAFSLELVRGKDKVTAAGALLDGALHLAEEGSWERIAVGRAWYLGGDKAKGAQILEALPAAGKLKEATGFVSARVYSEAGEWEKAREAFDRALARDPGDERA